MVRIGIVGAGNIGRVYADIIARRLGNAAVSSVTDVSRGRGEEFASAFGARFFPSIEELLKDEDTNTVAICAPTYLHAELFCKAAAARKDIFCDKPMALSLADADRMRSAARQAGVRVMMGHVLRFWPEYVRIKSIVDGGELGKPLHGVCERLCPIPEWDETIWFRDEEKSGGAALDVQIHDLDFLAWLLGDVKLIDCQGVHDAHLGGLRHLCTTVTFAGGVSGMVQAGWGLPKSFPFTMTVRVVCERGTIEWMFRAAGSIHRVKGARRSPIMIYDLNGDARSISLDDVDPYYLEWKYFVDRIDQGKPIEQSTLDDGYDALRLVLASVQSEKERRALELDWGNYGEGRRKSR